MRKERKIVNVTGGRYSRHSYFISFNQYWFFLSHDTLKVSVMFAFLVVA